MRKIFENPVIEVNMFCTENIITTSGVSGYTSKVSTGLTNAGVGNGNLAQRSYSDLFGAGSAE